MTKEDQNIEYKQSWHDEYLKWVCGFANAQGGKLIIGVDDDGNAVGIGKRQETTGRYPEQNPRYEECRILWKRQPGSAQVS